MSQRILFFFTAIQLFLANPLAAQSKYISHRGASSDLSSFKNAVTLHGGIGSIGGFPGVTGVLEYERFVDKEGNISLTAAGGAYTSGTFSLHEFEPGDSRTEFVGGYFAPGVRVHPLGNGKKVDIGLGISMPLGGSTRRDRFMDNGQKVLTDRDTRFTGLLTGQFICNFRSTKHVVFGISLSGGYFYANAQPTYALDRRGNGYLVFGLRMGGLW